MKKYKYSKSLYLLQLLTGVLLSAVFFTVLLFVINLYLEVDFDLIIKLVVGSIVILVVTNIRGAKIWLNRYVELKQNSIYFYSYQNGSEFENFEVMYKDIVSVDAKIVPIIGIKKIRMRLESGDIFEIPHSYCEYDDLCHNLITILKKDEYNVRISPNFQKYFDCDKNNSLPD